MREKLKSYPFSDRAASLFLEGYNCAQAVFAAFAPSLGIEEEKALFLASGFGGGFGRMREVCGAFSGITLVIGHLFGYSDLSSPEKDALYPRIQKLGKRFEEACGSLVCRELLKNKAEIGGLASERNAEYYASRPCLRVVEAAAKILEEYFIEEGLL